MRLPREPQRGQLVRAYPLVVDARAALLLELFVPRCQIADGPCGEVGMCPEEGDEAVQVFAQPVELVRAVVVALERETQVRDEEVDMVDLLHLPGLEGAKQAQYLALMRAGIADGRHFVPRPASLAPVRGPGVVEDLAAVEATYEPTPLQE